MELEPEPDATWHAAPDVAIHRPRHAALLGGLALYHPAPHAAPHSAPPHAVAAAQAPAPTAAPFAPGFTLSAFSPATQPQISWAAIAGSVAVIAAGAAYVVTSRIHTSRSTEWLVRTGLFVSDLQVGKTFVRWPLQFVRPISTEARTFAVTVMALTSEKLSVKVPMVWSVGVDNNEEAVAAFARRVAEGGKEEAGAPSVVRAALEGETRALEANLGIEDLFKARDSFAKDLRTNVSPVLAHFGLVVLNASVTELSDAENSKYFSALAETIAASAHNKAVAEVASANRDGKMAAKSREGETRIQNADVEAATKAKEGAAEQAMLKVLADVAVTRPRRNSLPPRHASTPSRARCSSRSSARPTCRGLPWPAGQKCSARSSSRLPSSLRKCSRSTQKARPMLRALRPTSPRRRPVWRPRARPTRRASLASSPRR